MNNETKTNAAFAWFLILGGLCFVVRAIIALFVGPPPSTGSEILDWIGDSRTATMWSNEALVIGAALMLVGIFSFQQSFQSRAPVKTTAGSVFFAAGLVLCLVLGIVQGRFVYPMYGLSLTQPEDAELLVSLFFGGYHMAALLFAAATISWALAMLKLQEWRWLGYSGFLVAMGSIFMSYPDLIGPTLVFILETALAVWWIILGLKLRSCKSV